MGKNPSKKSKQSPRNYEAVGPTESGYERYGPEGANPPNRSDDIFFGSSLPILAPAAVVVCRPFKEATRSPLHYEDGPGTDELVTSRKPVTQPLLGNVHADLDHAELRPMPGYDHNLYSSQPDDEHTTNGALIYGT